ncbi:MAG: hypothetical protein ACR2I2_00355 [Bryobacteraceae bacterium]
MRARLLFRRDRFIEFLDGELFGAAKRQDRTLVVFNFPGGSHYLVSDFMRNHHCSVFIGMHQIARMHGLAEYLSPDPAQW